MECVNDITFEGNCINRFNVIAPTFDVRNQFNLQFYK